MIEKISLFSNLKSRTITKLSNIKKKIKFDLPILKQLKQDIFEFTKGMPEVLSYNPPIVEGKFNHGITDHRFATFHTEYRAYNFEGFDTIFPNDYVCIDSVGDRRLKPHIYLNMVEIKPKFARKGAYKNAINQLVEASKFEGCEGRIILEARKMEAPDMAKIPSPSLAHWKCGFRFVNEDYNKIMKRVLKGELPLEDAPEGTMYYALL